MAAKAPVEMLDVDGVEVRLTSPDKIYFPELGAEGGSKRTLVEYYRTVATQFGGPLLAALRDRPTYLQRFPDGITGEEVYTKRVPRHAPDHVRTCRIAFPSGRFADALCPQLPADLVWAANQSTITFHPWHARCSGARPAGAEPQDAARRGATRPGAGPDPGTETPDELRIDLDPQPGAGFAEARAVALDVVAPLLDELGLIGFPKTSGGRGLHIYVRIEPRWGFTAVRRAAIAFARETERRAAGRVTTAWWKEQREDGTIFVDYNQNARDRTIASAYSARRTPRATVSTPVTWAELAEVEPDDCTVATVPGLLARRGDPMAGLDDVAHSLERLLELAETDEAAGAGDLPYPPNYPKMPGEPKRVAPSRSRPDTEGNPPPIGLGLPDLPG